MAELFAWPAGLDLRPRRARRFYLVLAGAIGCGIALGTLNVNTIRLLFLAAVLNGLLAPPLMVLVMLVGSNPRIMGEHVNGFWLNLLGWTATAVMAAAAVAFFVAPGS